MTHSGIDEWPNHGGGVQLVNIIGKAVGLSKSKGDKFNPIYRAKSKSLSEESRRLTSCSYPPNMYIALARTQAEWPSLAPGTVPEILGMNHLWVSVTTEHLALGAVATDASSRVQWRENNLENGWCTLLRRESLSSRKVQFWWVTVTHIYAHPACALF